MTDKHKHFFTPQTYNDIKANKNTTNTNTISNGKSGSNLQSGGGISLETSGSYKSFNPIGSSFSSGQYLKNYSSNMAHFYERIDNLNDGKKKE